MPVVQTDTVIQTQVNKGTDLTSKKAGDLAAATVHLFTNNITPTPLNVIGDFTEATFTGYAPVAVTGWGANASPPDGSVNADSTNVITFVGPSDASGQTIFGYFVKSAGLGTPLIYSARFAAPFGAGFPLITPADVLALVATFKFT